MVQRKTKKNKQTNKKVLLLPVKRESREIPDPAHQICAMFPELPLSTLSQYNGYRNYTWLQLNPHDSLQFKRK